MKNGERKLGFELLEDRIMLAFNAFFNPANGEIVVVTNEGHDVKLYHDGAGFVEYDFNGFIQEKIKDPAGNPARADRVVSIGIGQVGAAIVDNTFEVDVKKADFPRLERIIVLGGPGNDTLIGEAIDLIGLEADGGPGDDTIKGGQWNDVLAGGDGTDRIWGGEGADGIDGGAGFDFIWGEFGSDLIYGGDDSDWISGGHGHDSIIGDLPYFGSPGAGDTIFGGPGCDYITDLVGVNDIHGGPGDDTILFDTADLNPDPGEQNRDTVNNVVDGDPSSGCSSIVVEQIDPTDPLHYENPFHLFTSEKDDGPEDEVFYQVSLASEPIGDVAVIVTGVDPSEGLVKSLDGTPTLDFTPENWDDPQPFIVIGVDDPFEDGTQTYQLRHVAVSAADPAYHDLREGMNERFTGAYVHNADDEDFIRVETSGYTTDEYGETVTITVGLMQYPTDDVSITVTSLDTTEGLADVGVLEWEAADWFEDRTIVVTGVPDGIPDMQQEYFVTLDVNSADPNYSTATINPIRLVNIDIDDLYAPPFFPSPLPPGQRGQPEQPEQPGEIPDRNPFDLPEMGGPISLGLSLPSQPSSDVTVPVSVSDTTEVSLNVTSLTFTPGNWDTEQTVLISGVEDNIVDGDVDFELEFLPLISADPNFDGIDPADLVGTSIDVDVAAILVDPASNLITSESGGG